MGRLFEKCRISGIGFNHESAAGGIAMAWEISGNGNIGPGFLGTTDKEPLIVKTDAKEALRIDPAGNIGVGTEKPATKVEIVGNWNGEEGVLRLTGDKQTIKFAGVG